MSAVPMIDVTQEVVVKRVTPREVVHPRSAILDKDNKVNVVWNIPTNRKLAYLDIHVLDS